MELRVPGGRQLHRAESETGEVLIEDLMDREHRLSESRSSRTPGNLR